jgi:Xaa-Pro aminopeptidase
MITRQEYQDRMANLQDLVRTHGLQAFLITAQDSIYYLTGVTYVPMERPFFIIVRPLGTRLSNSPWTRST